MPYENIVEGIRAMTVCPYKNLFGAPGTGAHSVRIFNIAIVDVLLTVLVAWILSYVLNVRVLYTLPVLFLLGIVLHRWFCVRTTVDTILFP